MNLLSFLALMLLALFAGFVVAYLRYRWLLQQSESKYLDKEKQMQQQLYERENKISALSERLSLFQHEKEALAQQTDRLREQHIEKVAFLSQIQAENKQLTERLENQKAELTELQQRFSVEFENLANRLFRQHSESFLQNSGRNITELVAPLRERLQNFEKKVQDVYDNETRDKASLRQEVKGLVELNQKLSEDAGNLTKALKGDILKQGNWGEIVLERVLERSGLTKGAEYEVQSSTRNDDGQFLRPDVVIKLPENKHLIIDSKVSLTAYEQFFRTDNPVEKQQFISQHINSLRSHIKGLGEKNYQGASAFDTPDFVLLFLPIEPAFGVAMQHDPDIFSFAWEKRIVIVSPTTLWATLRTVSSIWKQEKQTQNALEIARQGGSLYDKFVGFIEDLRKLGNQINSVQQTWDEAHRKLVMGSGNLVGKVEKLRKLGVKVSRNIPDQYLLNSNDNDEDEPAAKQE
ncbi:MAG TPA: DNA recombination protein RmuC [Bacteroidales bacterium]|nr:DNA recombination protein RmuC [Bacteroidales bacterium]